MQLLIFERHGFGETIAFRTFEDVLGFGLTEGQLAELEAITPKGEREIGALIVSEGELMARGRWGGEAQPMRRRRIRAPNIGRF